MDWLQRLERRRVIRKLAGRILWKDIKAILCSWRVIFLLLVVGGYLVLPYVAEIDSINTGVFAYISMMLLTMLGMQLEPCFFLLPMTQKEIRQYITARTNLLLGGTAALSAGIAATMDLVGISVFIERGISSTLALLFTIGMMTGIFLYDNREKTMKEKNLKDRAKARKIRSICYLVFGCIAWCYQLTLVMFMKKEGSSKGFLMVSIVCFVALALMYVDMIRWTEFKELCKEAKRNNPWGALGRNYGSDGKKGAV